MASESCEEIDKSLENMPGVGDLVCVSLPPDIVKAMNSNIEEWTDNNNRVSSSPKCINPVVCLKLS